MSVRALQVFLYASIILVVLASGLKFFVVDSEPTIKPELQRGYLAICDDNGNEIVNTKTKIYYCSKEKFYILNGVKYKIDLKPYWGLCFSPKHRIEPYARSFLSR